MIQHCVYCHVTSFEGGRVDSGSPKKSFKRVFVSWWVVVASTVVEGGEGVVVSRRVMRTAAQPPCLQSFTFVACSGMVEG
jgi:hypothetical protein